MPNANWNYSLGPYTVAVQSVTGTGSITFTYASGSSGPLGVDASYTPPSGTLANGGNLGAPNGATNTVSWDGTNLSFTYSGYTYSAGVIVPPGPGQTTKFQGTISLPGLTLVLKNWTATK